MAQHRYVESMRVAVQRLDASLILTENKVADMQVEVVMLREASDRLSSAEALCEAN
eukprot:CAMPEP_0197695254 /NCGR_PEP_ID=MMETSP1338-20131121/114970_1 /TAXON_ID=43686 ORGANISM="Pelagodinium beii, Strain RCC1491" /NCGR_SAMPLE_ID=MMETSP1338 /ASSEMBLY_ACC=CAM_ASM_000754 /LENGTH=55 /DNA_ID=CAMNT_0043278217 /DNA_START=17 /DNA_END=181 /DNA_ORIENTATION=+